MHFQKVPRVLVYVALLSRFTTCQNTAQEIAKLRDVYDGAMRPDVEVRTFTRTDELLPMRVVERGKSVRPLPVSKTPLANVKFETGGKKYDLYDYLALNRIVGLLILKNGEV